MHNNSIFYIFLIVHICVFLFYFTSDICITYLFNLSLISLYSAFEHCIMDMWRFRNEYNNNNNNNNVKLVK